VLAEQRVLECDAAGANDAKDLPPNPGILSRAWLIPYAIVRVRKVDQQKKI